MKRAVHAPKPGFSGPLCGGKGYASPLRVAGKGEPFDCTACKRRHALDEARRAADPYQGLSERAKAYVNARHGSTWRICDCRDGARDVALWAAGEAVPTYKQVVALLCTTDALTLEDFGYREWPDGRVSRLLAPGHQPPPVRFQRASGDVLCATCGRPYWRHVALTVPGTDGLVLNVLCDGRRVKL